MIRLVVFLTIGLNVAAPVSAQENECTEVYRTATRNLNIETRDRSFRSYFFSQHCQSDGSVKSTTLGLDASAVIKGIPIDIGFDGSSDQEKISQFCKSETSSVSAFDSKLVFADSVVVDALTSFNQCVALSRKEFKIWHEDNHPVSATVTVQVLNPALKPKLTAVGYDLRQVECTSTSFSDSGEVKLLHEAVDFPIDGTFTMYCSRKSIESPDLIEVQRTPIQIQTTVGDYQFVLQADEQYVGVQLASQTKNTIDALFKQLDEVSKDLGFTKAALDAKDRYPVLVVGPFSQGALMAVPKYIRPVGCLKPQSAQDRIIKEQLRLACEKGYRAELVGEVSHVGGTGCGQTVVQIDCIRELSSE